MLEKGYWVSGVIKMLRSSWVYKSVKGWLMLEKSYGEVDVRKELPSGWG